MAAGLCDHWQRDESDKGVLHSLSKVFCLISKLQRFCGIVFLSWDQEPSELLGLWPGRWWLPVPSPRVGAAQRRSAQGPGGRF